MKNLYVLSITLLFTLIACETHHKQPEPTIDIDSVRSPLTTADTAIPVELTELSENIKSLQRFFHDWNQSSEPNDSSFINKNDTIKAVYDVFKTVYKPLDLNRLGNWEVGNELNVDSKYVVIQSDIRYSVLPSDSIETHSRDDNLKLVADTIVNFRPTVDLDKSKVLYLTQRHKSLINKFLGVESTSVGEPNLMSPSSPQGESSKRYDILRRFIPVSHGHWGGYWHIGTHPEVGRIVFNQSLTKARVYFRVRYQGGEASLEKQPDGWQITSSRDTWIE
jgi:hypothetical protein